jgi:hypothetical protein
MGRRRFVIKEVNHDSQKIGIPRATRSAPVTKRGCGGAAVDAGAALVRLDERIARSPVGAGWIERMHFADACASLWIDGELVHLEDLALHDAGADIRARPTN